MMNFSSITSNISSLKSSLSEQINTQNLHELKGKATKFVKEQAKKAAVIEMQPIDFDTVQGLHFEKKLGEGAFAVVYLCKDPMEKPYAVKKCTSADREMLEHVMKEVNLLKELQHENIVRCFGSKVIKHGPRSEIFILMEYAQNTLVHMMMDKQSSGQTFTESQIHRIFADVVNAVGELHRHDPPISHRDLKVENILIGTDRKFKLCDFGSAIDFAQHVGTLKEVASIEEEIEKNTTLSYRAPEQCDLHAKRRIDEKVDIWALGVILYYLCYFKLPFEESKLAVSNGHFQIPDAPVYSPVLVQIIRSCLTIDPAARPNVWQIGERLREAGAPCSLGAAPIPLPVQQIKMGTGGSAPAMSPTAKRAPVIKKADDDEIDLFACQSPTSAQCSAPAPDLFQQTTRPPSPKPATKSGPSVNSNLGMHAAMSMLFGGDATPSPPPSVPAAAAKPVPAPLPKLVAPVAQPAPAASLFDSHVDLFSHPAAPSTSKSDLMADLFSAPSPAPAQPVLQSPTSKPTTTIDDLFGPAITTTSAPAPPPKPATSSVSLVDDLLAGFVKSVK